MNSILNNIGRLTFSQIDWASAKSTGDEEGSLGGEAIPVQNYVKMCNVMRQVNVTSEMS